MRPRSASVRSTMPGSPTSESVWYDARDAQSEVEVGEEIALDSDPSDDAPSYDESVSRSPGWARDSITDSPGPATPQTNDEASTELRVEFKRRTALPSPVAVGEGSLFTALKKNIGKVQ